MVLTRQNNWMRAPLSCKSMNVTRPWRRIVRSRPATRTVVPSSSSKRSQHVIDGMQCVQSGRRKAVMPLLQQPPTLVHAHGNLIVDI